ncbi:hypothetical protein N7519_006876 [Penicillium mononematosum]|uniref:uncharacterized protein n=1 Tax=Penicillium mononematosum TaxID=268346 RepID=UPI00254824F2|nr:uncharacterized protein N7519_006876 [Penicillium mononematosum]KAJ6185575.1 hypothetical protein N7519_006876 [Penicillium mononematosum]
MAREGAVAVEINRQQQSRVSLIIVNAIGERLYGMLGDEKRDVWGRGRSFRCEWGSGYFQRQGSQRKRVKRRVPRVRQGGRGTQKLKARWDGAFKKWMDENGDGEGTELRDRLGEIWVLRAKDGQQPGKEFFAKAR